MIIPAHAGVKLSARLVEDQDPDDIIDLVADYINELAPDTVQVQVTKMGGSLPVIVDRNAPQMQAAIKAYDAVFGKKPVFTREGGTIRAVAIFHQFLCVPIILINLGLRDDGYHSPNEHYSIPLFEKSIQVLAQFYQELSKIN